MKHKKAVESDHHTSPLYLPNQAVAYLDAAHNLIACDNDFQTLLGLTNDLVKPRTSLSQILLFCVREDQQGKIDEIDEHILDEWLYFLGLDQPVVFQRSNQILLQLRTSPMTNGGLSLIASDASSCLTGGLTAIAGQLQTVVESITQGITLFDRNCNLVLCNDRFLELMDFPQELGKPGTPLSALFKHNAEKGEYGPGNVDEQVSQRMALSYKFEAHYLERTRKNGNVVAVNGNPVQDGFVTTYTDITARKKAAETLEEANKNLERRVGLRTVELQAELLHRIKTEERLNDAIEKEQVAGRAKTDFLANMSHELRTPLNCIIGFSELLRNEAFGPLGQERYRDYSVDINEAGVHLLEVLNDVLDVSKLETGEIDLRECEIDLIDLMNSSYKMIVYRAERQKISFDLDLPENLPYLYGDPRRIKQILVNVLSNAVKFSTEGGEVSVSIFISDDGDMCFDVIDRGIGISPEDLALVMEPFHQAGDALTRSHDGTGLGLHIVNSLVELHGGSTEIESKLDEGTTVHLRFPKTRVINKKAFLDKSGNNTAPERTRKTGKAGTKPNGQPLH
ncbi:PAS-domain containing protein [Kiloniella sp.]|uniref:sensor histidine kinase n=1 Tax=Kiloniella sp. TaxID=1938587 RepID=UPI003B01F393